MWRNLAGRVDRPMDERMCVALLPYEATIRLLGHSTGWGYPHVRQQFAEMAAFVLAQPVDADGMVNITPIARLLVDRWGVDEAALRETPAGMSRDLTGRASIAWNAHRRHRGLQRRTPQAASTSGVQRSVRTSPAIGPRGRSIANRTCPPHGHRKAMLSAPASCRS